MTVLQNPFQFICRPSIQCNIVWLLETSLNNPQKLLYHNQQGVFIYHLDYVCTQNCFCIVYYKHKVATVIFLYIHDYAVIPALLLSEHNRMLQEMLCLWVGLPWIPIWLGQSQFVVLSFTPDFLPQWQQSCNLALGLSEMQPQFSVFRINVTDMTSLMKIDQLVK
jgi:hypothetical protein